MRVPTKWPHEIKRGNSVVKIYRHENKGYTEFKVSYYVQGKRKMETLVDFENAVKRADGIHDSIKDGDIATLTLSRDERLIYQRAMENLKGLPITLDVVTSEYANAVKQLGSVPLKQTIEFWIRNNAGLKSKTVRKVVDEIVASRENPLPPKKPASPKYVMDLKSRLGRFAEAFHVPIDSITADNISEYLAALGASGRTWFNHARLLVTLFEYAKSKKYYPKEIDPFEGIEIDYEDDGEIEIFTPEELGKLLAAARPEILPFLVIGAFAGLRHAEITRLDWSDIKPAYIEVTKGKAKTRSRRLVPIQPNLHAWLADYKQVSGPIVPFANVAKQLMWLAEDAQVTWKHNALRHSFISYRMASLKNENEVATEAGNSPQMIYANYRELVTSDDSAKWFNLCPSTRPEPPAKWTPVIVPSDEHL